MEKRPTLKLLRRVAGIALVVGLAGCSVVETSPDRISIEHPANQVLFAEQKAEEHCAQFGKRARLVQAGPAEPAFLFIRGRVSVFECVEGEKAPAAQ